MNIYESESNGGVDLTLALAELKRSDGMTDPRRKAAVAELTAAALLDIAGSLRTLAVESALAMGSPLVGAYLGTEEETEQADEVGDFIVEGDLVAVEGHFDPGEVIALGFTEGSSTVTVRFPSGSESRFWLSDVHRLVGDERDDDTMQDAAGVDAAEIVAAVEGGGVPAILDVDPDEGPIMADPADLVDDIDADFDGAAHPEAESALDLLKANEAARKAAKKSGTKKGSKK